MSSKGDFGRFLVGILAPFVLILLGAGVTALGLKLGWSILIWGGLLALAAGLIWGLILFFAGDPLDL